MRHLSLPALAAFVASAALAIAACDRGGSASTPEPDAGVLADAAGVDGPTPGPDAAGIADGATDAPTSDASSDAGGSDGGPRVTLDEFPQRAYPNGWLLATQGSSPANYGTGAIAGSSTLVLFTDDVAGGGPCASTLECGVSQCVASTCRQRVKEKSPRQDLSFGEYTWRVYVPTPTPADAQVSVGAFLYADDGHELDFECGPGTAAARASATLEHAGGSVGPAAAGEMLCYMTSQGNPARSSIVALTANAFHTFAIALTKGASSRYRATWSVDGVAFAAADLAYGPADACHQYVAGRACTFQPFVSVENLAFIGDTYPTARNEAHFDWFRAAE